MNATFDPAVDAAYLSLREVANGQVARSEALHFDGVAGDILLDFDGEGRLVGIEVLGASSVLPDELLDAAER